MTIDDPGWGGFIGDDEPSAPVEPEPAPAGEPPAQPPRTAPAGGPPGRSGPPKALLIGVIAVVIVAAGVGTAVALSSSKGTTTTTTTSTSSSGVTTTTKEGGNTGNAGGSEPSLLTVVPSALAGKCEQTSSAAFVSTSATDEVTCDAVGVSGAEADLIGYVRFPSTTVVSNYFSGLLHLNGLTAGTGDCSTSSLSGSTSSGTFCVGSYTDSDGNSGEELAFLGTAFEFGGTAGNPEATCTAAFGSSSTGLSVIAWTSPGDDSFGLAVDCTDSTSEFLSGMQSNLVNANYVLGD